MAIGNSFYLSYKVLVGSMTKHRLLYNLLYIQIIMLKLHIS